MEIIAVVAFWLVFELVAVQPTFRAAARALGFWTVILAWVMATGLFAAGWHIGTTQGSEAAFGFPIIAILVAPYAAGLSLLWWRDHRVSVSGRSQPSKLGRGTRIIAGALGVLGVLSGLVILFGSPRIEWGAAAAVFGACILVCAAVTGGGPRGLEPSRRLPRAETGP